MCADTTEKQRRWKLPTSLRALQYPNYRLFISGQIVSLTGSWIHNTALSWLVYNLLTQSSFYLGLLNFALQIPVLVLGLFAGAVADMFNRHRLLIATQAMFMVVSICLAFLTLTHNSQGVPLITFGAALTLATFSGVLKAFDLPARQAFLLEMIPRHELPNAVAMNSLTFNMARVIGPSVAGLLIAQMGQVRPDQKGFGEGICFTVDAVSFLAVLYCLFRMKIVAKHQPPAPGNRVKYLLDGLRFVKSHRHVKALLIHLSVMSVFAVPYLVMMPVYAKMVLHGSANEYGSLMTAVGVGAVFGGIIMTRRKSVRGLGSYMARCVFGFCGVMILLALNSNFHVALVLLAFAGFSMVMAMIGSQTLVQTVLPENIRGRVMSIYGMISVGFLPLGSLLSGAIAESQGVRVLFVFNSVICAIATFYFMLKLPSLRKAALSTPEYREALAAEIK